MTTQFTAISDTSINRFLDTQRKRIGSLLVATALIAGGLAGQPASASALAPTVDNGGSGSTSTEVFNAPTQNERSIALIESKEAPVPLLISPMNSGFGPKAF